MRQRIADTITVDYRDWDQGGGLYIEGVRVPFAVQPPVHVDNIDGYVGAVSVTFYADNVEVVSKGGERSYPVRTGPLERELEWARREARRIVHEGMADVLEWLWTGATKALEDYPARYVMSLDEAERKALVSQTTHSDESGSEKGDMA